VGLDLCLSFSPDPDPDPEATWVELIWPFEVGCDSSPRSKISKEGDKCVLRLPLATLVSGWAKSFSSMGFVNFLLIFGDRVILDSRQCVVWLYVWVRVIMQYLKKLIRSAEISQILKFRSRESPKWGLVDMCSWIRFKQAIDTLKAIQIQSHLY
jgi:hypothetical protein